MATKYLYKIRLNLIIVTNLGAHTIFELLCRLVHAIKFITKTKALKNSYVLLTDI